MTREELEQKKSELRNELNEVLDAINDFEYEHKKVEYGDSFNCEFCKYHAYQDLSVDSWHNVCGADNCTCCHDNCEKFEPDNDVTLFIKKHVRADCGLLRSRRTNGYGYITGREYKGVASLVGDIFNPGRKSEKMIALLKACFDIQDSEGER